MAHSRSACFRVMPQNTNLLSTFRDRVSIVLASRLNLQNKCTATWHPCSNTSIQVGTKDIPATGKGDSKRMDEHTADNPCPILNMLFPCGITSFGKAWTNMMGDGTLGSIATCPCPCPIVMSCTLPSRPYVHGPSCVANS